MRILFFCLIITCLEAGEFRVIDGRDFPKIGMFSAANQILGQISIYETGEIDGLRVDFGTFGNYYDPAHGLNWWNYYFEPICLGSGSSLTYPAKSDYFQAFKRRRRLTRFQASELVKKHIHVREPILQEVDQFALNAFAHFYMIGVNYRGTDKKREAPRVSYETVFQTIVEHLPETGLWKIFVATDEHPFLEALQERFPGRVIACDAHRSENEIGVHFSPVDPYRIGKEALLDVLLLSRCHLLIRTSSNLSLWSTYFNPELPTILLNERYKTAVEPE